MSMELASLIDKLAINGVFLFPLDSYHNGLVHLVGNNYAHALFS
jgi:hypothetical protein